jgi:hypothetical protein
MKRNSDRRGCDQRDQHRQEENRAQQRVQPRGMHQGKRKSERHHEAGHDRSDRIRGVVRQGAAERRIGCERLIIFQPERKTGPARAGVERLPHHLRGRPIGEGREEHERGAEQDKAEKMARAPTRDAPHARVGHLHDKLRHWLSRLPLLCRAA